MIYLDNSATSHPKPFSVKLAMLKALTTYNANPGRSGHKKSIKVSLKVINARQNLSSYFGAKSVSDVIFTSGCTEALNLALLGTAKKDGHIITTAYEHNSVLRVLNQLNKTHNITHTIIAPNKFGNILATDITKAVNKNTYMVAINHTSNVTGHTQDIETIGKITKSKNLLFLVDCAQSAGHVKIDMQKQNINMLAVAGHKGLLGPQGVGALITNNATLAPIKFGGTGTSSESPHQPTEQPDGYESGTIATPNIIALNAGLNYVKKYFNSINKKTEKLTTFLLSQLNKISAIKCYSNNAKSGVVAFEVVGVDSNQVVNYLNSKNILVRGGLHCAPLIHKHLHKNNGLIRVSIGHKNTLWQIKKLIKQLKIFVLKYS